jgi:hypothetical protein
MSEECHLFFLSKSPYSSNAGEGPTSTIVRAPGPHFSSPRDPSLSNKAVMIFAKGIRRAYVSKHLICRLDSELLVSVMISFDC